MIEIVSSNVTFSSMRTLPKEFKHKQPLCVKPNKEELEELFNVSIKNDEELVKTAYRLIEMGAKNVIVSLQLYHYHSSNGS